MIDGPPQIDHLAVQLDVHLIEVPAPVPDAAHAAHSSPPDVRCEQWPESVPPQPHRLMAEVVATLEQQVLDVAQAERKPDIEHHHLADKLGR